MNQSIQIWIGLDGCVRWNAEMQQIQPGYQWCCL